MPKFFAYRFKKIFWCAFICNTIVLCYTTNGQKPLQFSANNVAAPINIYQDKSSVKTSIKSIGRGTVYNTGDKHIGYTVRVINTLKEEQSGTIITQVANQNGALLYKDIHPFKLKKRNSYEKDYLFESTQLLPGYYISNVSVVTNKYADTFVHSFSYDPEKVYIKNNPPRDLVNFWEQAKRDLSNTPANFSATPRPDLNNKFSDVYEIQYNSTDNTVIYGWLTVPKTGKRNAILYNISDYMSELKPEYRREVAVLSINTRGTGSSTTNYNYGYNELGLINIKDKNKYSLKGAVLDALRGIELVNTLAGKLGLNNNKIIIGGNGLGGSIAVILAALYPNLKGIFLDSPSFLDFRSTINFNEGLVSTTFPSSMFKAYYSNKKMPKDLLLNTLDYFDAVHFAPYVSCAVLIGFGQKNINTPPIAVNNFFNQLRVSKKDKYICKECEVVMDKGFYGFKETWLKEKFGQP